MLAGPFAFAGLRFKRIVEESEKEQVEKERMSSSDVDFIQRLNDLHMRPQQHEVQGSRIKAELMMTDISPEFKALMLCVQTVG
ncbi:hypothetical protein QQF64_004183 [Cirrhinus molitorella]|uniref:Uncharacterized protein n=1 Tax=Cirrhinus molitorella TaxID=172907 RepID=A0ABR3MFF9_9TELE